MLRWLIALSVIFTANVFIARLHLLPFAPCPDLLVSLAGGQLLVDCLSALLLGHPLLQSPPLQILQFSRSPLHGSCLLLDHPASSSQGLDEHSIRARYSHSTLLCCQGSSLLLVFSCLKLHATSSSSRQWLLVPFSTIERAFTNPSPSAVIASSSSSSTRPASAAVAASASVEYRSASAKF